MKFINRRPVLIKQMPVMMTHFGPNLSESQPERGNITPACNVRIPVATDVAARFKPRSEAMGLKSAEAPC